jgi:hypothetical protein
MEIVKKLTPAVIVVAMGAVGGLAYFSSQRAATAETPPAVARSEADRSTAKNPVVCEDREVEIDEGYALTRKELRHVCR